MFDFLKEHQLSIMMVLSGICGTLSFFVLITKTLTKVRKRALVTMELGAMFLLIADRYAYIYRGDPSNLGYWMVRISNFCTFFLTYVVIYAYNLYLKDLLINEGKLEKLPKLSKVIDYLIYLGMFLVILAQFTDFYYTFDEMNRYQRANGFYICYALPLVALVIAISLIIRCYKTLSRKLWISLLMFGILPLISSVVQIFVYGISLVNITIVVTVVAVYITALMDMNDTVERARNLEIDVLKEAQKNSQLVFEQTAQALASAIDAKDKYTHGHSIRVAEYSRRLARAVGRTEKECEEIYFAALLHDVGKIGIKDSIINKEGRLTPDEFAVIKQHPVIGKKILSSINKLPYLSIGANFHHERYDGKGYPMGLKGEDIPYIARIIAVADAYDAMTSKRSYREPLPQQKVREEIVKGMETQFDPICAKEMLHLIDLDDEYLMKEREDASQLEGRNEIHCDKFKSNVSEGILITRYPTKIKISFKPEDVSEKENTPTVILYDSLDARTHDFDGKKDEMIYYEYCEADFNGETKCPGARKIQTKSLEVPVSPGDLIRKSLRKMKTFEVEAVKWLDHIKLKLTGEGSSYEMIIALPDSARFAYLGFTGRNCDIVIDAVTKAEEPIKEKDIERIAEEISFINGPEGDVPNIQINGWRTASTEGIPVTDGMQISFHAMSLPTARLVWHCPFISLFYSDDGTETGENFREFCLVRYDGESWETDDLVENRIQINKTDEFEDWDAWKAKNKEGFDSTISIKRKGKTVTMTTESNGVALRNVTTIEDEVKEIYIALTGDQCALTNIRIKRGKSIGESLKGKVYGII